MELAAPADLAAERLAAPCLTRLSRAPAADAVRQGDGALGMRQARRLCHRLQDGGKEETRLHKAVVRHGTLQGFVFAFCSTRQRQLIVEPLTAHSSVLCIPARVPLPQPNCSIVLLASCRTHSNYCIVSILLQFYQPRTCRAPLFGCCSCAEVRFLGAHGCQSASPGTHVSPS